MKYLALIALAVSAATAQADPNKAINQAGSVKSAVDRAKTPSFDILAAHAHRKDRSFTFHITTNGKAGADTPQAIGQLGGAQVLGYVWPTSLDPSVVGFEAKSGILALAATSHPDFDDTPLFDENADGNLANDGGLWHSHWVVLTPAEACGADALAVRDIPPGETPDLPANWPGLPILIDSPGYTPQLNGAEISVTVAITSPAALEGANYDGVTAAMQVNAKTQAPLLCVTEVFDIASGDLSLPGKIN